MKIVSSRSSVKQMIYFGRCLFLKNRIMFSSFEDGNGVSSSKIALVYNFHSLEVVDRGSETQFQLSENSSYK